MGDYAGAADTADSLLIFKEKQQQDWQTNNIYEIQNRFDIEASEREIRSYRIYMACLAVVLVLAVVSLVLYHKYKVTKAKRSILEKRLLISEYSDRLDQFKHSQTETNKELSALRQRVNNLKDKELKVLSNGKLLYESIVQNHSTVHWSNNDFIDFIACLLANTSSLSLRVRWAKAKPMLATSSVSAQEACALSRAELKQKRSSLMTSTCALS